MDNSVDEDTECQLLSLEDNVRLTKTSEGRQQNVFVFHNSLKCSLQPLETVNVPGYLTRSDSSGVWNCF